MYLKTMFSCAVSCAKLKIYTAETEDGLTKPPQFMDMGMRNILREVILFTIIEMLDK